MKRHLNNQRGFTLTEMMMAVTITSIFVAGFMTTFLGLRNSMYAQDSYTVTNRTAYYAMNVISKDLRETLTIEDSATVCGTSRTTGTSVLVLRLPSINSSGIPTSLTSQYDYVAYYLNGTNLIRSLDVLGGTSNRNGGSDITSQIVARNVSALTLTNTSGTAFSSLSAAQQEGIKRFNLALTSSETIGGVARSVVTDSDLMVMNK